MAVRIKESIKPYTAGVWIEITENKVINVLLRAMNNLIRVNEDNELYVDLQLDAGISPDDDFPVWVTTGEILQEDWRYQSGTILNWKTTSWDYVRLIYANDNKLYYDPWTGIWIEIWTWGGWVQIWVATASALGLIKLGSDTQQTESAVVATAVSWRTYPVQLNADNQAVVNIPRTDTTYTAGANITIDQNNEISCTIPPALIYKGNVNWIADLPSSGQQVWDTYFVVWEDAMYSWDWTQWNYVWGTGIDISDLFNKRTDDSDDITEGTTNLFVTVQEKNYWNSKQDPMIEWHWIDITDDVITNTLPFEPENAWVLGYVLKKTSTGYRRAEIRWFDPENAGTTGQVLKKTATGYRWEDESWWWTPYTAGDWIDITNHVVTNTKPFDPENQGQVGDVLTLLPGGGTWWTTPSAGTGDVKLFSLASVSDLTTAQQVYNWVLAGKLGVIRYHGTYWYTPKEGDYYFYPVIDSTTASTKMIFHTVPTSNDVYIESNGKIRHKYPTITFDISNWEVTNIDATSYTVAEREDTTREWHGTQAQYEQLTPETGVVYNILPNS